MYSYAIYHDIYIYIYIYMYIYMQYTYTCILHSIVLYYIIVYAETVPCKANNIPNG